MPETAMNPVLTTIPSSRVSHSNTFIKYYDEICSQAASNRYSKLLPLDHDITKIMLEMMDHVCPNCRDLRQASVTIRRCKAYTVGYLVAKGLPFDYAESCWRYFDSVCYPIDDCYYLRIIK